MTSSGWTTSSPHLSLFTHAGRTAQTAHSAAFGRPQAPIKSLKGVVTKLDAGRKEGKMGPAEIHQLSVLVAFEDRITDDEIGVIERIMQLAVDAGIREVSDRWGPSRGRSPAIGNPVAY